MNALFGQLNLMPADRIRQTAGGLDIAQTASYFGSCQEGGVQLSVHLLEALNFAAPAQQLAEDSEYRGRLLTLLKDRQREAFRRERAPGRQAHRTHEGLIHAVLYWVPPTFRQFERAEISFFREISQLSILIPIIGKADLYTEGELKHLKLLVPMALVGMINLACLTMMRRFELSLRPTTWSWYLICSWGNMMTRNYLSNIRRSRYPSPTLPMTLSPNRSLSLPACLPALRTIGRWQSLPAPNWTPRRGACVPSPGPPSMWMMRR